MCNHHLDRSVKELLKAVVNCSVSQVYGFSSQIKQKTIDRNDYTRVV